MNGAATSESAAIHKPTVQVSIQNQPALRNVFTVLEAFHGYQNHQRAEAISHAPIVARPRILAGRFRVRVECSDAPRQTILTPVFAPGGSVDISGHWSDATDCVGLDRRGKSSVVLVLGSHRCWALDHCHLRIVPSTDRRDRGWHCAISDWPFAFARGDGVNVVDLTS